MPKTFFVGDHRQMFPHLKERLIITVASSSLDKVGKVADNVALVNGKQFYFCYKNHAFKVNYCILGYLGTDLSPILEKTEIKKVNLIKYL